MQPDFAALHAALPQDTQDYISGIGEANGFDHLDPTQHGKALGLLKQQADVARPNMAKDLMHQHNSLANYGRYLSSGKIPAAAQLARPSAFDNMAPVAKPGMGVGKPVV